MTVHIYKEIQTVESHGCDSLTCFMLAQIFILRQTVVARQDWSSVCRETHHQKMMNTGHYIIIVAFKTL